MRTDREHASQSGWLVNRGGRAVRAHYREFFRKLFQRGQIANVLTLKNTFDQNAALAEVGARCAT